MAYDPSKYYIDFSDRDNLTDNEKLALERIQRDYLPLERITFVIEFRQLNKITDDDWETLTSVPYTFD